MFCFLCPVIISISTELIREHEAQIEPLVTQSIRETTGHIGLGMFLQRNGFGILVILCDFLNIVSILVHVVGIELRCTGLGVDSGKFYHVECTVGLANHVNLRAADNLGLFAVQFHNLILVVRKGERGRPVKVFGHNVLGIDFQFHTLVLHLTDIHQIGTETGSHRYGTVHQKVLSSTGIVLQSEVQTVEEAEVQTDIQVVIRFPFQIPIFNLRLNQCGILHIAATKARQAHIAV